MPNDFTGDAACMGVYNFESGALTTDSSPAAGGNGANTLTNINTVTADTTNYQQGAASALFDRASLQEMRILQAGMSAGFPWQSTDSVMKGTVCCWFRSTNPVASTAIVSNMLQAFSSGSWALTWNADATKLAVLWRYSTGYETLDTLWTLPNSGFGTFHLGLIIDGVNKVCTLRTWDGSTAATHTMSPANAMVVSDLGFCWGNFTYASGGNPTGMNGNLDEGVVFNRMLSIDEIDAIRGGTYTFSTGGYRLIPRGGVHCNLTVA